MNIIAIDESTSETEFNKWRKEEVDRAGNRNVSLSSCHGFAEMADKPGDKLRFAAMHGDKVLGLVTAVVVQSRREKRLEFAQLYVILEARGSPLIDGTVTHVAHNLVHHAKDAALALGAKSVALGVGLRNQKGSLHFWKTRGFKLERGQILEAAIDITDLR